MCWPLGVALALPMFPALLFLWKGVAPGGTAAVKSGRGVLVGLGAGPGTRAGRAGPPATPRGQHIKHT